MEENVKPIKPEEILDKKAETIPAAMILAVNKLIALNWNGHSSTFRQDDLLAEYFNITGEANDRANHEKLFAKRALDFEDVFRREGWKVVYDKPAYNESYEPTFEFSVKKN
jgi:hypothetical protein